jgi:hypothetical protein
MDLKCWIRIRIETNSDPQHSFEGTEKSFSPDQKIKNVAGSMNLKRQYVKKQCERGCKYSATIQISAYSALVSSKLRFCNSY